MIFLCHFLKWTLLLFCFTVLVGPAESICGCVTGVVHRQVHHTWRYDLLHTQWYTWPGVFVTGDRELAPGNLNPLLVVSEQLTCWVSEEAELTLALSSPCWRRDSKGSWHKASASGGTLLSHVFVWVQSLIEEAGSQWIAPQKAAGLINRLCVSLCGKRLATSGI